MREAGRWGAGQPSKVVSSAYCQGQDFPSLTQKWREIASGHRARSLNKKRRRGSIIPHEFIPQGAHAKEDRPAVIIL